MFTKRGNDCRLLEPLATDGPARLTRIASVNSAALLKHFSQLTAGLLQPFTRYMQPAAPPPGAEPLPSEGAPPLAPFSHAEFLDSLQREQLPPLLLSRFQNKVLTGSLCA